MSISNGVIKKSKNKNGLSAMVKRGRSRSSESNSQLECFRGFSKVPQVYLTRFDITPYINKINNIVTNDETSKDPPTIYSSLHKKRLAQECSVILVNQDLQKLKQTIASPPNCSQTSTDSLIDLEKYDIDNTVKCKICQKAYSCELKLQKHQEIKHMIEYKPNAKTEKRVSFSDHVIIHEVKEYHKCRKCSKIFEEYRLLKMHMKEFHRKHAVEFVDVSNAVIDISNTVIDNAVIDNAVIDNAVIDNAVIDNAVIDNAVIDKAVIDNTVIDNAVIDIAVINNAVIDNAVIDNAEVNKPIDEQNTMLMDQKIKPVIDQKSKKTLLSKHKCQNCNKYYSSGSSLNRHIQTQHSDYNNLKCKVCKEKFAWPSLLKTHKCLCLKKSKLRFKAAPQQIQSKEPNEIVHNGFDDLIVIDDDDYMQTLDFEIPEPIVEMTEYENFAQSNRDRFAPLSSLGYKIEAMQEVPIEF